MSFHRVTPWRTISGSLSNSVRSSRKLLSGPDLNPSAAKSYIATMDFFCGSRMHACIAAVSSGVPVVPIAYSRKFAGVFGALGYGLIADCGTQTADEIVGTVIEAFDMRDALRTQALACQEAAGAKLEVYKAILRRCIEEAVREIGIDTRHGTETG